MDFPPPYSSLCTRCGTPGHAKDDCPTWLDHQVTSQQAAWNREVLIRELDAYEADHPLA